MPADQMGPGWWDQRCEALDELPEAEEEIKRYGGRLRHPSCRAVDKRYSRKLV